jgi:archaetidylinositol phosphate synthase
VLSAKRGGTESLVRMIAAPFVALRIPPNVVTVLGLALMAVPAYFIWRQEHLLAGVTLAAVALFDTIDGAVARARNRVTPFGGFLDSVTDRAADAVVLIAIGVASDGAGRWWIVLGAGIVGQYLTSYTRARAYEAGTPPRSLWNQFFERPERIIFLCVLFVAAGWVAQVRPEVEVLYWGMVIYATLTLFTSLIRVVRVYNFLGQTEK